MFLQSALALNEGRLIQIQFENMYFAFWAMLKISRGKLELVIGMDQALKTDIAPTCIQKFELVIENYNS